MICHDDIINVIYEDMADAEKRLNEELKAIGDMPECPDILSDTFWEEIEVRNTTRQEIINAYQRYNEKVQKYQISSEDVVIKKVKKSEKLLDILKTLVYSGQRL